MQTRFWKPLKGIVKIYGMAQIGVVCGLMGCLVAMIFFGVMWSIGGAIPGYFLGDYLASRLHDGRLQRMIRWYLPFSRKESAPPSSVKMFF